MAKKKKEVKPEEVKPKKANLRLISIIIKFLRIIAIIFCSLLIHSLLVKNQSLILDFQNIQAIFKAEGLWAIFNSGVELINPVGPLGTIIGYSFSYILGHYLTAILALGVIIKNLIALFGNSNKELRHNITLFMGFFFFLQLIFTNFNPLAPDVQNGVISIGINNLLIKIIGTKGTTAFLFIILILDILLIFGWEPVKTTFIAVGKTILYPFYHKRHESEPEELDLKKDRRTLPNEEQIEEAKDPEKAPDIAINNHKDRRKELDSSEKEFVENIPLNEAKTPPTESNFKINQQEKNNLITVKKKQSRRD